MRIRATSAALVIVAFSTAAVAQQHDAFDACAQERDPAARLACFDRQVAARHATDHAAAASASSAPVATAPSKTPNAAPGAAPSAAAGAAPSTPRSASEAPAPPSAVDRDVGLDARELRRARRARGEPEPPPPAAIAATVVRVIPRQPLISAVELDNGQIWEQSEAVKFSARPREKVTIRPGVLGSFFLKSADGSVVRVHRLK